MQAAIGEIIDKACLCIFGKQIGEVLRGDVKLLRHRLQRDRLCKAKIHDLGCTADQKNPFSDRWELIAAFLQGQSDGVGAYGQIMLIVTAAVSLFAQHSQKGCLLWVL